MVYGDANTSGNARAHQEMHHDIRKCESTSGNYLAKTLQGISSDRGAFPDVGTNNFLMCTAIPRNSLKGLSQIIS
jgi:hypothetical protein